MNIWTEWSGSDEFRWPVATNSIVYCTVVSVYLKQMSLILYVFMFEDGFYSAAPLDSPRGEKLLSVQIRPESEHSRNKYRKLSIPVNMKNRNIADYFGLSIVFLMTVVRIPCSAHSR